MQPEQAKGQLLKMLEDDAMEDVVTIVTNMPADKRKKILAEFKVGTDAEQLYEILKNIRKGEPIASTIQDARQSLTPEARTP
jgi:ACT domain-containing protein